MQAILSLLFSLFFVPNTVTINVKTLGAKGDGVTDDTQVINAALAMAQTKQANVYFPAGTYVCNQVDVNGKLLYYTASGQQNISIFGDGPTSKITTKVSIRSQLFYIICYKPSSGLSVKNISFENTHGLTTYTSQALFFQGTLAQELTNVTVSGCTFNGFSTALGGQGIYGFTINGNTFGAPHGHDDAMNNSQPAVFCWLFDNENGYCKDVKVTNNTANGYTGTAPMSTLVTHRPMDGFLYGTAYGITVTGNTTKNFSEEHYGLQPKSTIPSDTSRALVENNYLDCSMPAGTANSDGSPHNSNYGIRCDISDATITKNTIINYTYGILIRAVEYPNTHLRNYLVTANELHEATDTVNYKVSGAISVTGGNYPVSDMRITGNTIYTTTPDTDKTKTPHTVKLNNLQRGQVTGNTVNIIH